MDHRRFAKASLALYLPMFEAKPDSAKNQCCLFSECTRKDFFMRKNQFYITC